LKQHRSEDAIINALATHSLLLDNSIDNCVTVHRDDGTVVSFGLTPDAHEEMEK
jgi:hypothetical protein